MHPLQMINHLILPRKRASTTLQAALATINRAPETASVAIMSRCMVSLQVGETGEGRAWTHVAFEFVVARGAGAEDEADDGVGRCDFLIRWGSGGFDRGGEWLCRCCSGMGWGGWRSAGVGARELSFALHAHG